MFLSRILMPCAAGALILPLAPAAFSQDQDSGITVTAPRSGKWSSNGEATETVSHSIRISVVDLDLTSPGGMTAAEGRIRDAAKKSCTWLDAHYPVVDSEKSCEKNAVTDAMVRARALAQR